MPVPSPELGSFNFVQETKVRHFHVYPCAKTLLTSMSAGKPRLGRSHHPRLQSARYARGQAAACADPSEGRARGWLLLREELQHLAGAREPSVRHRQAAV